MFISVLPGSLSFFYVGDTAISMLNPWHTACLYAMAYEVTMESNRNGDYFVIPIGIVHILLYYISSTSVI